METIQLKNIIGNLGDNAFTSTTPNKCLTNDGYYIVKFAENKEGIKVLINEYIVHEICTLISINTPKAALIQIPTKFHDVKLGDDAVTIEPGLAFGSKIIPQVSVFFSHKQIQDVMNPITLFDMILLDHIIDNRDRDTNPRNILFCREDGMVYLIDHERVFGAGSCWDCYSLKNSAPIDEIKNFIDSTSVYSHIRPYHDFDRLIEVSAVKFKVVTKQSLHDIIYNVPSEWGLSIQDKDGLIEYLHARFLQIDYLVDLLKMHSKGGIKK